MHIKPKNVFKAICYGHQCSVVGNGSRHDAASLVDISPTSARLMLLPDQENDGESLLRKGDSVALRPEFLERTGIDAIPTRVSHVFGKDVTLRFETPLPFTSSRLVSLTRR